ncbi:MAG: hypothetical protein HOP13_12660 [Alphaproteobacteria bacterium]|nr:hypothetical protein [Alphaproteobacteria bacterium]
MPLKAETFDFISNLDTLTAVVAGAVLATAGGFIGTQIEHRVDTRRRERQAALFFGEIMALLGVTVGTATRARGIGDPFGPVTMRILRMIRRELDVYDRNRERLFELRDPALRARIHTTLLRTMMGVEGALESAAEVTEIRAELQTNPDMPTARREHLDARLAGGLRLRDGGFDFLVEASEQAARLTKELEPIARIDFEKLVKATRDA